MNVAKISWIAGALALTVGSIASSALADTYCASCQLQARQQSQASVSLGDFDAQVRMLAAPVSSLRGPFSAPQASAPALGGTSKPTANWDVGFELPGTFHPKLGEYNPSFSTPFWTVTGGFVDAPSAPWNQFVPASYGHYFFNQGMRLAGPFSPAPFSPAWN